MKNWNRFQPLTAGLLLLLFVATGLLPARSFGQGVSSSGTDYWISFMPNYLGQADNIRLFVASGTANKVQVDVYGGSQSPQQHFTQQMQPDKVWTLSFPSTRLVEERVQETPEYKAIHVYSQNPIAVYGLSNVYTTTDSYLAIPTPALGTDYYPACMYDDNYNELGLPDPLAGEFVIIAPYDKTVVTIGPAATDTRSDPSGTISHPQGSSWTVELQKGQTYLVQSTGLKPGDGDLTGTHIRSTKPIGVISGHQRCRIPVDGHGNSKDHIMEMMIPIDKWGTQYYDMPQGGRLLCGNYVRLIAGEDGCYVTENGQGIAQLDKAGDFVDRELVLDPVVYTSNGKKFAVVEYSYSQNFNGDPVNSDPFGIIMTPQNQFEKKMIFRVPNNVAAGTEYDNFGTFIALKDSVNRIIINGKRITAYQFAGQGDFPATSPQMSAYRIKFPDQTATYVATSNVPFGCYIYGFSYAESYGHPAGMALKTTSPDTLPPLQALKDSACGNFNVKLNEPRLFPAFSFDDTRIADIALIQDSTDFRWSKASYNYRFEWDPNHPFTSGDSVAYFKLNIIDGSKSGYAAVWTTDRAGNDTVYQYYYTAPNVDGAPSPLVYDSVWVNAPRVSKTFVLHNHQSGALTISNIRIVGSAVGGIFEPCPSFPLNATINPNDSISFQVCFTATDTVTSFDTLKLDVNDCLPFQYVLQGTGMIPQIVADDVNFGNVNVGDTVCKLMNVRNVGKLPFVLTKQWLLNNSKEFSFADNAQLPITLDPGHSVALQFCFHPDTVGAVQGRQDWGTNQLDPFMHSIKDTSSLLGYGRSPGLDWDRPTQDFTVQCNQDTIRMYLVNSSPQNTGSSVDVTGVTLGGPDAGEFAIIGMQQTPPFDLSPAARTWVDVQFKPDITKFGIRQAKLVAAGTSVEKSFAPEIALTGVVRHSTLRLAQSSYDFGKVYPNATMDTDVWIYNDGDTNLVLTNITIDGGFSIVGFTSGQIVRPRDSVKVTVHRDQAALGTMNGTLTAMNDASCTPSATATFKGFSSVFLPMGTGFDYKNVYFCSDSTNTVMVQDTGTESARLLDVRIVDSAGTNGASQFSFPNGQQIDPVNTPIDPGKPMTFTIKYKPASAAPANAWVVYHFRKQDLTDVYVSQPLAGIGLHYANTVSVHNNTGDNTYHAIIGNDVMVPVRLTSQFDANAKIYGFTYSLRYKRDMFNIEQVVALAGLSGSTATPTVTPDPNDPDYQILTVKQTSSSPILAIDTVAKVYFKYVLNKENTSTIDVSNVAFLDQNGNTACWVDPSNEPGVFTGSDVCGDLTIRNWLNGIPPSTIKAVHPNPMSGTNATIEYGVTVNGTPVTIELYDLLGKKVATLVNDQSSAAGDHVATIDGSTLNGGTYVLRLTTGLATESMRFVVTK